MPTKLMKVITPTLNPTYVRHTVEIPVRCTKSDLASRRFHEQYLRCRDSLQFLVTTRTLPLGLSIIRLPKQWTSRLRVRINKIRFGALKLIVHSPAGLGLTSSRFAYAISLSIADNGMIENTKLDTRESMSAITLGAHGLRRALPPSTT
jgi:hypothetical protein